MSGLNRPPLDPAWYCGDEHDVSLEEITSVDQLTDFIGDAEKGVEPEDGDDDVYAEKDVEPEDEEGDAILDKTIEFDLGPTGLKVGVHFPKRQTAEKSIRKWCDKN